MGGGTTPARHGSGKLLLPPDTRSLAARIIPAWITVFLALAGLTLLTYPTAASWVSQYNQTRVTGDYSTMVSTTVPDADMQLAVARQYNKALASGALVASNERIPTSTGSLEGLVVLRYP